MNKNKVKKLSQEQANFLIEKLRDVFLTASNARETIESIINYSVKEPFPEFSVNVKDAATVMNVWQYHPDNKSKLQISLSIVSDDEHQLSRCFQEKEFRDFAERCNKIVGWMDEQ